MKRGFAIAIGSLALAAGAQAGVMTHTFVLDGLGADGGFFNNFPTLQHDFGAAGSVTNIEFTLNLTANDPSWLSEALIFIDGAADGLGDFEAWSADDYNAPDASGTFTYSDNFAVDILSPAGIVSLTMADSFTDAVTPDHFYTTGSFVTVTFTTVPTPGAAGLVAAGGLMALRRRRR